MRSRLQDHVVDLHSPHLTLGSHTKYSLNQVSWILKCVNDGAPERKSVQGITIDWINSLDLDDAVWIEKTTQGGYCVWIHISDVSEVIPIFSPLDIEALHRTTSIYRRDTIHNMFPCELVNGVLSLDPNWQEKLTCTLQIDVNKEGDIENYDLYESRFTNLRRYDYESFWSDYVNLESEHFTTLRLLNELSTKLRVKRILQWWLLHFWDDDRRLFLDDTKKRHEHATAAAKVSHDIIESLMVLANTTVWNHLAQHPWVPSLYRRHDVLNESSFYYHKPCQHAGLKVENYTHFTSPIRRYIDLVIHRVLKALIRWDDVPYTQPDVQFIAVHANNVRLLVDTYWSQIDKETRGHEFIEKIEHRLWRPPLVCDMKMTIKKNTVEEKRLPKAILQAISDNIQSKPRDTWIWSVGVILLSRETDLKKLLKDTILNHTGMRVRWFLNVLWQTRITLWEDPIFTIEEQELEGQYHIQILCRGVSIVTNSCDVLWDNAYRDLPHQCRRECVWQLFDFFIDADDILTVSKPKTTSPYTDTER
jgi:hypothetical protein